MRLRQVKKYFKKNIVNIIGEPTKYNEYQTYAALYWIFQGQGKRPSMYAKRMLRYLSLDPEIRKANREANENRGKKLIEQLGPVLKSWQKMSNGLIGQIAGHGEIEASKEMFNRIQKDLHLPFILNGSQDETIDIPEKDRAAFEEIMKNALPNLNPNFTLNKEATRV